MVVKPAVLLGNLQRRRRYGWFCLAIAVGWAFYQAGLGRPGAELINWGGLGQLGQFFAASWRPDLTPIFLGVIAQATLVTFAYGVCGTSLSLILGFFGGLFLARITWQVVLPPETPLGWLAPILWRTGRAIMAIPRAIHELVWGLFLLNILGLDPLVAILAIAIPFGAIVSKVFAEILEETDPAPLKALLNAGAHPLTALLYGLLPQATPNLLSYSFYRFECSLRSAAVLGVIGAGGLGYEIFLSLQSLRYEQLWTGFYALMILSGVVDMWSAFTRKRMGFTNRLDINAKSPTSQTARPGDSAPDTQHKRLPQWPLITGISITGIILSFWSLDITWSLLWSDRTRQLLGEIMTAAIPASVSADSLFTLAKLSLLTVAMSIVAMVLAGVGGIIFSFIAAQNIALPGGLLWPVAGRLSVLTYLIWGISRLILLLSRAIPAPIWALVLLFVLFPGILPGALALGIHNFGILGRLMAEVNENLDGRSVKALRSLGASGPQLMIYGILPQNMGRFLAYILYRWEVSTRETVIVGLVGAGGLGRLLTEQISGFDYAGVSLTLTAFVMLTFIVDMLSQSLRQSLR